ncbi:MAG: transcriptional regulator [Ignavibacteriales bacterium]|nr:transcriptional regulator [Ignavibacteriales bacterium]MCF8314489.1 transcriptional regulator [Ignavibacteriales bacterium]MCF8436474.1 transcriptional regulator [Ignavibacteriales bacterium]
MFEGDNMNIKPIKTEQDYEKALRRLEIIFDASPETQEGDEAEILSMLIENYENQYYPINAPDPIEAIKIRMEEMDIKQKDLIGIIGGKSRVSEVLNKKKSLTVEMIRELEKKLHISASILVANYQLMK